MPPSKNSPTSAVVDSQAFKSYLQGELVRRCKLNQRYSLRAFARFLAVEPSALSKILAGKRIVSAEMFDRAATRLALGPAERASFCVSKSEKRAGATAYDSNSAKLTLDAFQAIADWYHMAILELVAIRGFQSDPRWIARALGISPTEAAVAIERLLRLGLLETGKSGQLRAGVASTTLGAADSAAALRSMQKQVLELAIKALEHTPIEDRDQSTMTFAASMARLPAAKEMIKNFRRDLTTFLESRSPREEVFHLSISLYPVTAIRELQRNKAQRRSSNTRNAPTLEDLL